MGCSENGNFAVIATTSGIYPKISILPVLSQINTIDSFVKVKISDFQNRFHDEYALPTPARHENRSKLTFLCIGRRLTHFPAEYWVIRFHEHHLLLFLKSCEVRCNKIGQKTKLSKSSSRHFDDSMAAVCVLRSDKKSAQYFTFFTVYR